MEGLEATRDEKIAILDAVDRAKQFLDSGYHPDGYNIGINIGMVAGQVVMHLHIHVIPRYKGDSRNHGGGMRRVIPDRRRVGSKGYSFVLIIGVREFWRAGHLILFHWV